MPKKIKKDGSPIQVDMSVEEKDAIQNLRIGWYEEEIARLRGIIEQIALGRGVPEVAAEEKKRLSSEDITPEVLSLAQSLGLPKNMTRMEFRLNAGEHAEIDVTYHPEVSADDLGRVDLESMVASLTKIKDTYVCVPKIEWLTTRQKLETYEKSYTIISKEELTPGDKLFWPNESGSVHPAKDYETGYRPLRKPDGIRDFIVNPAITIVEKDPASARLSVGDKLSGVGGIVRSDPVWIPPLDFNDRVQRAVSAPDVATSDITARYGSDGTILENLLRKEEIADRIWKAIDLQLAAESGDSGEDSSAEDQATAVESSGEGGTSGLGEELTRNVYDLKVTNRTDTPIYLSLHTTDGNSDIAECVGSAFVPGNQTSAVSFSTYESPTEYVSFAEYVGKHLREALADAALERSSSEDQATAVASSGEDTLDLSEFDDDSLWESEKEEVQPVIVEATGVGHRVAGVDVAVDTLDLRVFRDPDLGRRQIPDMDRKTAKNVSLGLFYGGEFATYHGAETESDPEKTEGSAWADRHRNKEICRVMAEKFNDLEWVVSWRWNGVRSLGTVMYPSARRNEIRELVEDRFRIWQILQAPSNQEYEVAQLVLLTAEI